MVRFALLNELSLPFESSYDIENNFLEFFRAIKSLKEKEVNKLRVEQPLQSYIVYDNICFPQYLGQLANNELRTRLKSFIANGTIEISSPLIEDDESESDKLLENEYFYEGQSTNGALACCDIWQSLSISFTSKDVWKEPFISLKKQNIIDEETHQIKIRNISNRGHIDVHQDYFEALEECIRFDVNNQNFWDKREFLFPSKIVLCKEIEKQIKQIDIKVFYQALSILRDLENGLKELKDLNASRESQSVAQNPKLRALREFDVNGKKEYFENHIKSFSNGYRMHYFEDTGKIYIGYIGKHLATKKFD